METKEQKYRKEYYKNNKTKIRENQKQFNLENPNYKKLHNKKYNNDNKEELKDYWNSQKRKNNKMRKDFVDDIKKGNKCCKCGENRYYLLDFHHIDPNIKLFNLGEATKHNISKIKEEISKCILLCRNCHSEFHFLEKLDNILLKEYLK